MRVFLVMLLLVGCQAAEKGQLEEKRLQLESEQIVFERRLACDSVVRNDADREFNGVRYFSDNVSILASLDDESFSLDEFIQRENVRNVSRSVSGCYSRQLNSCVAFWRISAESKSGWGPVYEAKDVLSGESVYFAFREPEAKLVFMVLDDRIEKPTREPSSTAEMEKWVGDFKQRYCE